MNAGVENEKIPDFIVFRYARGRACVRRPSPKTPEIPRRRRSRNPAVTRQRLTYSQI
jgi:hypothetical protein